MRNYIFATTLFFLVNSCSEHEGNSQSSSINNVDTFTTYLINSDGSSRPLIDLVDQVEIVRLEETNESLLSGIAFLGHSEEQYAVTSWSNSDIHIFSQSGKFIRKINHQGNGPEEYPGIANFWATDNSIGISGGGFIIEYDWQGSFINKRKNPHMSYHTFPYQDGYVMDMSQSKIEENEHHSVIVVDSALQIESLLIPSKHHEIGLYGANSFASYKNSAIYHDPFSDTVYTIKNGTALPLFSLDFGDNWAWKDESIRTDREKSRSARRNKNAAWVFTPYVGEEHILVNCRNAPSYIFIDRKAGTSVNVTMALADQDPLNIKPIQWEGNKLAMSLPSAELSPFLSELTEDQIVFSSGATLEEVESSENPVLIWVKFK